MNASLLLIVSAKKCTYVIKSKLAKDDENYVPSIQGYPEGCVHKALKKMHFWIIRPAHSRKSTIFSNRLMHLIAKNTSSCILKTNEIVFSQGPDSNFSVIFVSLIPKSFQLRAYKAIRKSCIFEIDLFTLRIPP